MRCPSSSGTKDTLVITHAHSGTGLRSYPSRYAVGEEVDGWPADLDQEGNPVYLMIERTSAYPNRKIYLNSTPNHRLRHSSKANWMFHGNSRVACMTCISHSTRSLNLERCGACRMRSHRLLRSSIRFRSSARRQSSAAFLKPKVQWIHRAVQIQPTWWERVVHTPVPTVRSRRPRLSPTAFLCQPPLATQPPSLNKSPQWSTVRENGRELPLHVRSRRIQETIKPHERFEGCVALLPGRGRYRASYGGSRVGSDCSTLSC
jgi:hypothetical protein